MMHLHPGLERARTRERRVIALNALALAFAVRLFWILRFQSPFAAVYSDMGGYVMRAEHLLKGTYPDEPRILALWPWGTHALVAIELGLFGHSPKPIAVIHALVGAIPAACAVLMTARFIKSRVAIAAAGVVVALWHPHVIYSGFFSSEIWFTAFLWIFTLAFVRHCDTDGGGKWSAFVAGVSLAVCFAVRPQILLTCVIVGAGMVLFRWRPRFRPLRWRWALLLVPLLLAMAGSGVRLYRLTGKVGLIAAYQPVQRLFGETNVDKIEANWVSAKGIPQTYWFNPHTKQPVHPQNIVHINGFVCDPELIAKVREERLRGVPLSARVRRMIDNIGLLAVNNVPWPEDDFRRDPKRAWLQRLYARITLTMLPFVLIGLFCLRRNIAGQILIWANILTILIVAALYLGEARYRVPYDTFAIVAAVVGIHTLWARLRRIDPATGAAILR